MHNVETMFSVREVPWHGLGNVVQQALTSDEAMHVAGLDWEVEKQPIFLGKPQKQIDGLYAITRSTDREVYGVVSNRYQPVQNREAFDFVDSLAAENIVRYETAGSLQNGKMIWLLAKMDNFKVLDDDYENYLVFCNYHDGKNSVTAAETPIRVVCNNTLTLALAQAQRTWKTGHRGDVKGKLRQAQETLSLSQAYVDEYQKHAEVLYDKKIDDGTFKIMVDQLFPYPELVEGIPVTPRKIQNVDQQRSELSYRYLEAPDIRPYKGTGYGVVNAVADYVDHTEPLRKTSTYQEKAFARVISGTNLLTKAHEMVIAA